MKRPGISKSFMSACLFLGFALVAATLSVTARAESTGEGNSIEIIPAKVAAGPQMSWFQCPCFRWVVQVQAASGQLETRDFLISSDSLFTFHEENSLDFQEFAVRLFKVGASEALWKTGHVGIGFDGVTWGEDRDRGYNNLLQTGFYGLVNLLLTEAVRLDLHSGVEFERMNVNNGPTISRDQLAQAAALRWRFKGWSGTVNTRLSVDTAHPLNTQYLDAVASASVRGRIFSFHDIEMGLGFNLTAEHDGWRGFMGLDPDIMTGTLLMDLSYVGGETQHP